MEIQLLKFGKGISLSDQLFPVRVQGNSAGKGITRK